MENFKAELARFVDRFGYEKGAKWFLADLTFEDAERIERDTAEMKKAVAAEWNEKRHRQQLANRLLKIPGLN